MAGATDIVEKLGLPAWLVSLLLAFTGGAALTAVLYESVRIPGLKDDFASQERQVKELTGKLNDSLSEVAAFGSKHAECLKANAQWAANAGAVQDGSRQLQECQAELGAAQVSAARLQGSCSNAKQVERLQSDKNDVDWSLSRVQLGHDNWNSQPKAVVDERLAELRRRSNDLQTQILVLMRCDK